MEPKHMEKRQVDSVFIHTIHLLNTLKFGTRMTAAVSESNS